MTYTSLTPMQKLHALAARFYSDVKWEPKVGDFYTTARADLELYEVVAIEAGQVSTRYATHTGLRTTEWDLDGFTTKGFGPRRVFVPRWVLEDVKS